MSKPKNEPVIDIVCETCGHVTSGPSVDAVNEAHDRHKKKTGHK